MLNFQRRTLVKTHPGVISLLLIIIQRVKPSNWNLMLKLFSKEDQFKIKLINRKFPRLEMVPSFSGWWFQTFVIFHNIWVVILPIDELHHFSRWLKPPTRYIIH